MSIERSALPFEGVDRSPQAAQGVMRPWAQIAGKYLEAARFWLRRAMDPGGVTGIIMAPILVVGTAILLRLMLMLQELPPASLTFLIPILVAAIRWGTLSAALTAVGGAVILQLFFYNPFYAVTSVERSHVLGIFFFLLVSLVSAYLASRTRRDAARALKRENEIRDLYTFSQRLSAAQSPAGIFEAMQQHLGMLVGRKVVLCDSARTLGDLDIPKAVSSAVAKVQSAGSDSAMGIVADDERGNAWLVRPVSANTADFGIVAVDLGRRTELFDELRARVVAVIGDAASSLERLGVARTLAEARTRAETEQFREALIGNVSHELRTPLSSILGASTVLSLAPEVTGNSRLKKLAALIHQESERLNVEIQNILDASRISSNGLQAKFEWAEPADFLNAALQRCHNRLANRAVEVTLPEELVLLRIDPVLMERALGQFLDNAAKYSPPESVITVRGQQEAGHFAISVTDQGAGLDPEDRALLGQKFFRGPRHAQATSGLGLGFWIATAFVAANNGTIEVISEGMNKGTTVTIRLPLAMKEGQKD
jgi:two-component system, OmpR family, sensor histidine kinase KdpD